CQHSYGTPYNF
nr:immunoglobulin light chain junction region [Macaca mulatta]MOX99167.1 immunoglobulin light chain junction region [Macaca mulatta]MOX99976.1 immunoglobulin light chain junction region [Macaca mulatta]